MTDKDDTGRSDLASQVEKGSPNIVREFAGFLMSNKKFWLAPIIVLLLLAALVIVAFGTAVAPWLYAIW